MVFRFRCFTQLLKKKASHDTQLMICMSLKVISLSGKSFVQLFIIFVVSVKYFFAGAPLRNMTKFFFQKEIGSYASWVILDTSRRFCFPHLMFAYSLVTISVVSCSCCDSVVFWRGFVAFGLAGLLAVTILSLVFLKQVRRSWLNPRYVKKLCTLQDVLRKSSFSHLLLVTSNLLSLVDGFS